MPNLSDYGFDTFLSEDFGAGDRLAPARVSAVHRDRYELIAENGEYLARLRGACKDFITVGDFVRAQLNDSGDSIIHSALPRKTFFTRQDPDPRKGMQAVAANFDYVLILTSLNQNFKVNRIVRYLAITRETGALPIIVLTKADVKTDFSAELEQTREIAGDAPVFAISTVTDYGMNELRAALEPRKTLVFLGSSGVGKSTLINALAGKELMKTGGIREDDGRGKHTTTHRQLYLLDSGVIVIDTPGMRSIGLWEAEEGVNETFADILELAGECRFSDCTHTNEPDCAVTNAIRTGKLSRARFNEYKKLEKEAERRKRHPKHRYSN